MGNFCNEQCMFFVSQFLLCKIALLVLFDTSYKVCSLSVALESMCHMFIVGHIDIHFFQ